MKRGVWILLLIGVVLIICGLIISVSGAECKTTLTPICDDNENGIVKLEKCPSFYCVEDKDCDDGNKCNGVERCNPANENANGRGCVAGEPLKPDWNDWEIDSKIEEQGCYCTPQTIKDTDLSSINFFSDSFDKIKNIFATTGNAVSISKKINSENIINNGITGFAIREGESSRVYNNLDSEVTGYLRAILKGKRADGAWIELKTIIYGDEIKIPANGYLDIGTGIDSNGNKILEGWNERDVIASEIAEDEFGIGYLFSGPEQVEDVEVSVGVEVAITNPPGFFDDSNAEPIDCNILDADSERDGQQCWYKRTDKNGCYEDKKEAFDCSCQKIVKKCAKDVNAIETLYVDEQRSTYENCGECQECIEIFDGPICMNTYSYEIDGCHVDCVNCWKKKISEKSSTEPIKIDLGCVQSTEVQVIEGTLEEINEKLFQNDNIFVKHAMIALGNSLTRGSLIPEDYMDILVELNKKTKGKRGRILEWRYIDYVLFDCSTSILKDERLIKVDEDVRVFLGKNRYYIWKKIKHADHCDPDTNEKFISYDWYLYGSYPNSYPLDQAVTDDKKVLDEAEKILAGKEEILYAIPYGQAVDLGIQGDWKGSAIAGTISTIGLLTVTGPVGFEGTAIYRGTKIASECSAVGTFFLAGGQTTIHAYNEMAENPDALIGDGKTLGFGDIINVVYIGAGIYRVSYLVDSKGVSCKTANTCLNRPKPKTCNLQSYRKWEVRPEQYANDIKNYLKGPKVKHLDIGREEYIYFTYEEKLKQILCNRPGVIVDLPSHIKGGKFYNYGELANGKYVWIIDEGGYFVVSGARGAFTCDVGKIPHSVLAGGKPVYGAGEIIFENGFVKEFNSITGHYFPGPELRDIFNAQTETVFRNTLKCLNIREVPGGARFTVDPF